MPGSQKPSCSSRAHRHTASPADFPDRDAERTLTVGTLARVLRSIAASPERWWGLVRFEPGRSVQVTVEECAAYRAWLVVLPPGDAGQSCDCDVATMIAGEATEGTPSSAVLRPGPVRVHGERHGERTANGTANGTVCTAGVRDIRSAFTRVLTGPP